MSDNSRIALVTGGSGGIGRQVAARLAADGMSVVVHYAGNPAPAGEVAKSIVDGGGTAVALQADVAEPQPVEDLFDAVEQQSGGIEVVVHTAGRGRSRPGAGPGPACSRPCTGLPSP